MKKYHKEILNNKGETLIESLVSILMLVVITVGMYNIITSSLNMINISNENHKNFRKEINPIIEGDFTDYSTSEITFKVITNPADPANDFTGLQYKSEFKVYKDDDKSEFEIVAFKP